MMTMALHSRWMGVEIDTIHATGGAAANRSILQTMADVFGGDRVPARGGEIQRRSAPHFAPRMPISTAASRTTDWDEVVRGFAEPVATESASSQTPRRHEFYRELMQVYAACEAHASGRGPIRSRFSAGSASESGR